MFLRCWLSGIQDMVIEMAASARWLLHPDGSQPGPRANHSARSQPSKPSLDLRCEALVPAEMCDRLLARVFALFASLSLLFASLSLLAAVALRLVNAGVPGCGLLASAAGVRPRVLVLRVV